VDQPFSGSGPSTRDIAAPPAVGLARQLRAPLHPFSSEHPPPILRPPLCIPHDSVAHSSMHHTGADNRSAILQGTLDLMVLTTLEAMGPMHGYGIARRLEQVSEDALLVNQGSIYLCLIRLVQKRWISAKWGTSENNRKAKFYSITKAGRKQLAVEADNWVRLSGVIGRLLRLATGG
jgi:PadR family transcriptional regulator PadR